MINIFNKCKINHTGFTLAEVLITIGIIGIVAALTIPTLLNTYKEKVIVNKLLEVYSILSQGYKMSIEDNGPISCWNLPTDKNTSREMIMEKFLPYIKSYLVCDGDKVKCEKSIMHLDLQGKNTNVSVPYNIIIGNTTRINIDNTGGFSTYLSETRDCNGDGGCYINGTEMATPHTIMVNVTGKTNRPRWGEDLFVFAILDRGIVPYGDVGWQKQKGCNPEYEGSAGWWSGTTCAGYVIKHKNLNYLRCVKGNKKYCTGNYAP
ncbi:MAG: type II secretion system protein [Candidatus Gastranaerophilaceae bacterium]